MRATLPGKIKDFAHLPLHRGGFPLRRDWVKLKLFGTTGTAGGFLYANEKYAAKTAAYFLFKIQFGKLVMAISKPQAVK